MIKYLKSYGLKSLGRERSRVQSSLAAPEFMQLIAAKLPELWLD
jgi:hypothetical protein